MMGQSLSSDLIIPHRLQQVSQCSPGRPERHREPGPGGGGGGGGRHHQRVRQRQLRHPDVRWGREVQENPEPKLRQFR